MKMTYLECNLIVKTSPFQSLLSHKPIIMSESALVIVDNHKKMEYYYCHEGGSIDMLGVEICLNLHEPNYFYSADDSDWKDGFSHFFKGFRFQKYKKLPSDLASIECVYHISFGKENYY